MTTRTPPRRLPTATWPALLLAAALVALGVVAVRDLAVDQGWTTGSSWTLAVVDAFDGLTTSTTVVTIAIALGVVGLLLAISALRAPRTTHLRTDVDEDLWISRGAVAALAQAVADRQRGVVTAAAEPAGRRKVVVDVVARGDAASVRSSISEAISAQLRGVSRVKVDVRVKEVAR